MTCIGLPYMVNTNNIKVHCKFTISNARVNIFSFDSNVWVVYSLGTISTNHICPKAGTLFSIQISSGHANFSQDVLSELWAMSLQLMNQKMLKSIPNGLTGPGYWGEAFQPSG
jgi:hypothetical protein